MKEALAKERVGNNDKVKTTVRIWLTEVGQHYFNRGIEKLGFNMTNGFKPS